MTRRSILMNADTGEKTWLTPPNILAALGHFDTDPCCPPSMPWRTADTMLTEAENGITALWTGRVWLNPPYGREAIPFLRRMAGHRQGGIALIFARTDTTVWQDWIFPYAFGVLFLRGRLRFCRPDGTPGETAPAPSALIAYSQQDFVCLCESGLTGALMRITPISGNSAE